MYCKLTNYIRKGIIDNRVEGQTKLTLYFKGSRNPINFSLGGNCLQDLAGCLVEFKNPHPEKAPGLQLSNINEAKGIVGDITASQRYIKGKNKIDTCFRVEFFSAHSEIYLIESDNFELKVSLPEWKMNTYDEQVQIMTNQQAFRTQVLNWIKDCANNQEDAPLPDYYWDKRLREADAIATAYLEIYQKYHQYPDGDIRVAFVMGWDDILADIAQAEESGSSCTSSNPGFLTLYDILTDDERKEVESCMNHPLFMQVMEISEACQQEFVQEIYSVQKGQADLESDLSDLFQCLRFITPRILASLLHVKDSSTDYRTLSARMELCSDQIKQVLGNANTAKNANIPADILDKLQDLLDEVRHTQQTWSSINNHEC